MWCSPMYTIGNAPDAFAFIGCVCVQVELGERLSAAGAEAEPAHLRAALMRCLNLGLGVTSTPSG